MLKEYWDLVNAMFKLYKAKDRWAVVCFVKLSCTVIGIAQLVRLVGKRRKGQLGKDHQRQGLVQATAWLATS